MARSFGKIEATFWQNPRVRALSERGRYLLNYLFACPHGNSIGCFKLPIGYAQDDLMWPSERVIEHVRELVQKAFIDYDEQHSIVRVIGWFGHNTIENKNVAKGAVKAINALPATPLRAATIKALEALNNEHFNAEANTVETRSEPVPKPVPTPEPEPEPSSDPSDRAQAPSLSDPPFALTPEEAPKPERSPLDLKADFWRVGKAYLAKHGEKNPGALIGRWCRDHGNGAVMDALAKAAAEAPADPKSFIERILRGPNGKRPDAKPDSHAAVRAAHAAASGGRPSEPGYLDPFAPVGPGPEAGAGNGQPVVDLAPADFGPVDHGSTGGAGPRVLGGRGPDRVDGEVQGLPGGAAGVPARLAG